MFSVNNTPTKNWICRESFEELLKLCFTVYKVVSSRKVETEYKIVRDEKSVERGCSKHRMTFWQPDDSAIELNKRTKVLLDNVSMFYCPLSKMDLKFPKSDTLHEVRDFYITEGQNENTIAVLRNSTSCDNICVTNMYRPEDDFFEELWYVTGYFFDFRRYSCIFSIVRGINFSMRRCEVGLVFQ